MARYVGVDVTLDSRYEIKKIDNSYILYDADLISDPALELFDRDYHVSNDNKMLPSGSLREAGIGRAEVTYFCYDNMNLVLKHYFRGGLVASLVKDKYLGFDIEGTRAFKEWRLLKKMHKLGLPVPVAVAAHVDKGLFYYRADLITKEIENVKTLAEILSTRGISAELWKKVGACIKIFHHQGVYHADLNARNILLRYSASKPADVYLIDFDNSCFRVNVETWKMANLARLKRSLLKFRKNRDAFNFSEENWAALLEGYRK